MNSRNHSLTEQQLNQIRQCRTFYDWWNLDDWTLDAYLLELSQGRKAKRTGATVSVVAGVALVASAASASPVVQSIGLDKNWLVLQGIGFVADDITSSYVQFHGDEGGLPCEVGTRFIECDVRSRNLQAGIAYRIRYGRVEDDRRRTINMEVAIPVADAPGGPGGPIETQRIQASTALEAEAGTLHQFEWRCDRGRPVFGTVNLSELVDESAWRMVDQRVDDCGEIYPACFVAEAKKLIDGSQPLLVGGHMACQ